MPVGRNRDWIPVTTLAVPTVWLATADGLVCLDLVAVELAANGLRDGWTLTSHEAAFTADLLLQRGMPPGVINRLIGVSGATFRKWFPTDDTPLHEALTRIRSRAEVGKLAAERAHQNRAQCGTYNGALRHRKRGEPLCSPCREAKKVADRHYRAHGTYIGAPGVAA
ncbi:MULTISPECIES: hypothetical protein [unclassified Streptomyces]|uniref:hypothetical protein n=1 Tax=unclassified Streptomyces TaxID=2593676 RepID=UPI00190BAAEF|nr:MULTISPECIES: hypothetical protein [unclassified Streptomyces]MBK3563189.1 hypothetical protein [Streptomyces sp. MBT62]MBK6013178.1 hypothetical protein [Streptomyces sp. MBT53]